MTRRLFLVPVLMSLGSVAHGATVYEGFAGYADGAAILANNGGSGFVHEWKPRNAVFAGGSGIASPNSVQLRPSSLAYTDATGDQLQTAGGSLFMTGEYGNAHIARTYDETKLPNPVQNPTVGTVTYMSFLARRSGPAADPNDPVYGGAYPWGSNLFPRVAGVNLWSNDNGDAVPMHVGNLSNTQHDVWTLNGQDLDDDPPRTNSPFGAGALTYLVVFKFEHGTGDGQGDEVYMYMNPLLGGEGLNTPALIANWEKDDDPLHLPGSWVSVEVGSASSNRPYSDFSFDEFRIGSTWDAVTPIVVPEPGAMGVAGLVLGVAASRRRRRTDVSRG